MNRRSLLRGLFGGAAAATTAIVAPMAIVGSSRKFVVPEKLGIDTLAGTSLSVASPTVHVRDSVYGAPSEIASAAVGNEVQVVALEPQHTLAESLPEPATPYGAVKKDEIVYVFLNMPCVLKFWELRCTNSNVQMVETVLRGIQDAAQRGITTETPWRGQASAVMIDPWPNSDLLLRRAEAVKAEETTFRFRQDERMIALYGEKKCSV